VDMVVTRGHRWRTGLIGSYAAEVPARGAAG
jgi:hypothetical protein